MINDYREPMSRRNTVLLFILFLTLFNYDLGAIPVLYWGITLICSAWLIYENNGGKIVFVLDKFWGLYILFNLFCIISLVWSINRGDSFELIKGLMVNILVLYAVYSTIRDEKSLKQILVIMLFVFWVNAIYLMIKVDWSSVGTNRLGVEYTGKGWNANAVGLTMTWGIAIATQLLPKNKRLLKIVLIIPMLVILGYSGSRKAWLALVMVAATILFLRNKKKLLRNILIGVIVLAVGGYLIMNVQFLYDLGGYRFEQLILGLLGRGEVDHSTLLRQEYARLGMEWFKSRPIFGYGIDGYRELLFGSYLRTNTYAHNNYVELLVDVGVIGTALFYGIYLWVLRKGVVNYFRDRKTPTELGDFIFFLLCLTVIQLMMHVGMVAYTDLPSLIIVMVLSYAISISDGRIVE